MARDREQGQEIALGYIHVHPNYIGYKNTNDFLLMIKPTFL